MNERIVDLYEQASSFASEEESPIKSYKDRVLLKFAELIVADCYQKLIDMDQQVKGSHNYYKHAAVQIKLHFGVEQ